MAVATRPGASESRVGRGLVLALGALRGLYGLQNHGWQPCECPRHTPGWWGEVRGPPHPSGVPLVPPSPRRIKSRVGRGLVLALGRWRAARLQDSRLAALQRPRHTPRWWGGGGRAPLHL